MQQKSPAFLCSLRWSAKHHKVKKLLLMVNDPNILTLLFLLSQTCMSVVCWAMTGHFTAVTPNPLLNPQRSTNTMHGEPRKV